MLSNLLTYTLGSSAPVSPNRHKPCGTCQTQDTTVYPGMGLVGHTLAKAAETTVSDQQEGSALELVPLHLCAERAIMMITTLLTP